MEVEKEICEIIAKEMDIDPQQVTLNATLKELEIPSLDAIEIIFKIEEHFDITLPDRDPDFDTGSVRGLVEAVERLLADKAGANPVA